MSCWALRMSSFQFYESHIFRAGSGKFNLGRCFDGAVTIHDQCQFPKHCNRLPVNWGRWAAHNEWFLTLKTKTWNNSSVPKIWRFCRTFFDAFSKHGVGASVTSTSPTIPRLVSSESVSIFSRFCRVFLMSTQPENSRSFLNENIQRTSLETMVTFSSGS